MTPDDARALIQAKREDRSREFKESFPWRREAAGETMARVSKTILAMSNLRDGGRIVVGVAEPVQGSTDWRPVGVDPDHLGTFSFDTVADFVRKYAEPYARFDLDIVELGSAKYVVIAVEGFDEVPVVCKVSYGHILAEGAVYVRPRSGRPRSEPVSNYADMRELLDLAVERGIRRFLRAQTVARAAQQVDEQLFSQQIKEFL